MLDAFVEDADVSEEEVLDLAAAFLIDALFINPH
jgi:hypothetical protein